MSDFQELALYVEDGMNGRNSGIPMGFKRLNQHVSIRNSTYYLIGGYTGCLSGDTIITVGRASIGHKSRKYTLRELYYKFNAKSVPRIKGDKRNGNSWDRNIDTKTLSYFKDKSVVGLNNIVNVFESGIKKTFILRTDSGKEIRATENHRFLVDKEQDKYILLKDLQVGNSIYCRINQQVEGRKKRPHRPEYMGKFLYYPTAKTKTVIENGVIYKYKRIKRTRAVFDAALNNVDLITFMEQIRINPNHGFIFSDVSMDIHHIDENPINDVADNLRIMTKKEHSRLHSSITGMEKFRNRAIGKEKIVSISFYGEEMTYDIEMQTPYNNFLANEFIVHNSGKTSLLDDAFILNPLDYLLKTKDAEVDMEIIYFSMERNKRFKHAKWITRKIFLDTGRIIPINRMLGWVENKLQRLSFDEHDLFLQYEEYIDALMTKIILICGPQNPTGFRNYIQEVYAPANGELDVTDKYNHIYTPKKVNKIVLIASDHIGLTKGEKNYPKGKPAIDKSTEDKQRWRDVYGFSPVDVSQFNRDIANPSRIKAGDVEPMLEDFKETGNTQENADVVLSLFDPMRYKVKDPLNYDLDKLRDVDGRKKYRLLKILKNSYGSDDIRIGLAFQPEVGYFKEMIKQQLITDDDYQSIIENHYFLNK